MGRNARAGAPWREPRRRRNWNHARWSARNRRGCLEDCTPGRSASWGCSQAVGAL